MTAAIPLPFIWSRLEISKDEDGEPVTSCVVVAEGSGKALSRDVRRRLPDGARIALDALHNALEEVGERAIASNHIPLATPVVTLSQWREYSYQMDISGSGEDRAMQLAFQRSSKRLKADGFVGVWNDKCWIIRGPDG